MTSAKPANGARIEPRRRRPRRRAVPEDAARTFDQLRHAILGPERSRIENLEERPAVAGDSVGAILPEAVARATHDRADELSVALEPTVTRAVTVVARRQPELYGEILAPTIGAAVKKAVAEAIAAMLERFNEALERSLSIESVRWRIEAKRTGRPFAEVVLLRTLRYRVEQVFLIHTSTSLVLLHLAAPDLEPQPPDQIAGMLAAIDTFGRDAFGPMSDDAHLQKFEMGELKVWLDQDPSITVVAVVRGTAASEVSERLRDALTRVHLALGPELASFAGDVSAFGAARPILDPLLELVRNPPRRRAQVLLLVTGIALLALIAALVAWSRWRHAAEERLHRTYVAALASEPGILVTDTTWDDERGHFVGARDPLARVPEQIARERGLPTATFDFAPFVSLDPRIVEQRVKRVLAPPPAVTSTFMDGSLRLAGHAPRAWIHDASVLGRTLPGIDTYDDHALRSDESLDALRHAGAELEQTGFTFAPGVASIAGQTAEVAKVASAVETSMRAAAEARVGACVEITGYADDSGSEDSNRTLSAERAERAAERLVARGVDATALRTRGGGTRRGAGALARRVVFHLAVDEARTRPGCGGTP